ncbi:hypothetical protein CRENBAI_017391 [Crenichthys baileyi]|uniref:Uncharacterized protein n=1 Tax=Crenichthys baileyi TaxID=28760 RepID=A0AAV9RXM2_9TELE
MLGLRVCIHRYLPGAGGDLCKFAQSTEGVAPVHVIQRLGAVPQQAEAHRLLGAVVLMLVAAPQLVLNDPGGGYEAEAADGHQGGGQEHPEAAHTAEHGGSGLGKRTRGQTKTDPEPGFFFYLLPAQEPMHLERTAFRSETLTSSPLSVQHYTSNKQQYSVPLPQAATRRNVTQDVFTAKTGSAAVTVEVKERLNSEQEAGKHMRWGQYSSPVNPRDAPSASGPTAPYFAPTLRLNRVSTRLSYCFFKEELPPGTFKVKP